MSSNNSTEAMNPSTKDIPVDRGTRYHQATSSNDATMNRGAPQEYSSVLAINTVRKQFFHIRFKEFLCSFEISKIEAKYCFASIEHVILLYHLKYEGVYRTFLFV